MKKLVFVLLLFANAGPAGAQSPPAWTRLAHDGAYAFLGTVEKTGASTIATLPASDANAIVKVEKVFHAPVSGLGGQRITVMLVKGGSIKVGSRALFFAAPGLFSDGIALREVGHVDNVTDDQALSKQVDDAYRMAAESNVSERLAGASMVISGKVAREAQARPPEPASEHDPMWRVAEGQVDSVEKGKPGTKVVSVYFPTSRDIRWFAAPRFTVGQTGVWLLRSEDKVGREVVKYPGLTALHPLDFQQIDRLPRLRELLKASH